MIQIKVASRRRRGRAIPPRTPVEQGVVEPLVYTVQEFAKAHRLSRSKVYELLKQGLGPRFMTGVGERKLITREDAAAWRSQCSGQRD